MNVTVRAHELRAAGAGSASVPFVAMCRVERVAARHIGAYAADWADLASRALEPNVFLDPAFALPLMEHVGTRHRPGVLLVWDGDGRLLGLWPIHLPRLAPLAPARGHVDRQGPLGIPLLDRAEGAAAFVAMLDWLAQHAPRWAALVLNAVPADGAFMRVVVGALGPTHRMEVLAAYQRAALLGPRDTPVTPAASARRRKERKRQRRRLAEHGVRAYVSARSPEAVARALEQFFALENKGWKGRRGTALHATAALGTFTRQMMARMAEAGRCRIDALEIDGRPVAMGIILTCGDHAYFWKTAFDQTYASLSPGVQFATDLAEAQLGEADIALTDSCAVPDHPMIDRLWPDRLALVDVAIAPQAGTSRRFRLSVELERARRRLRAWAKLRRDQVLRRAELTKRRRVPI